MKPIELTKEEYHQAVVAAWNQTRKLAGRTTGVDCDPGYFYSIVKPRALEKICEHYKYDQPAYRSQAKKGVARITHYLDERCNYADPKTKANCLAKVGNRKDGYKYYQCAHLVGQCPWKE